MACEERWRRKGVNSGTNTNTLYSQTFLKSPSEALTILSRTYGKVCTSVHVCHYSNHTAVPYHWLAADILLLCNVFEASNQDIMC